MLNSTGFSLWADDYDESVAAADRAGEYPFAGYSRVMETVYQAVYQWQKGTVLDVGFGTATLAKRLYDDGFTIYGIDFSPRMVELARAKMPNATLLCQDMKQGLPAALAGVRFDRIVATYSLHHLTDEEKPPFLRALRERLNPNGSILLGDVAFRTRAELQACRERSGSGWDDAEFYMVFAELQAALPDFSMAFEKASHCSAVITLR